jgi:hypothetical protein
MVILYEGFSVTAAAIAAILIFSISTIWFQHMKITDQAQGACIGYNQTQNTIIMSCLHASFSDLVSTINDPAIIAKLGRGEYLLNASLRVNNSATFEMGSGVDGLQYLKIAGTNGIIVNGKIQINGIKITSWDPSTNNVVPQNIKGSIKRAYIQFGASEGAQIINSEFAYLGYNELGRRGFDLFGDGGVSHDMRITGSRFHHMWRAFYSTGAYNVTIDRNEFHHNINYGVDPHSGTHDIKITNNWIHHDPIGIICSVDCYNILIEGNKISDTTKAGIFFSRGMQHSTARSNYVYNTSSGIILSESPNNLVYNNTIEAAKSEGVLLYNPAVPDEGLTQNNQISNNTISISNNGINSSRSHNNILTGNKFNNITSSEYHLTRSSNIRIMGQHFDNASITSGNGSSMGNIVEIVNSGIIEVTEVNDVQQGKQNDNGVYQNLIERKSYYNTENTPYRKVMSGGVGIIVNS